MSLVGVPVQQPGENLDYDIDCSGFLNGVDTLADVQVTVTPSTGLSASALVASETSVKVWISGGQHDEVYVVELSLTTAGGRVKEAELEVHIQETEELI